ncbi:hypothetical protein K7432_007776 [Basidiobolus ranarum]|uniref:Uncharacterized protein n=1 Tax=Basidiobolus ranarum TaxID=34480 RepID=A0ABR2W0J7_9FUNG
MFRRKLFTIPFYTASASAICTATAGTYYYQTSLKKVDEPSSVPSWSLLQTLKSPSGDGDQIYRDCFSIRVPKSQLSLPTSPADQEALLVKYVGAFYTSPVFKLERFLINLFSKSSPETQPETDQDILSKEFQLGDTVASNSYTVTTRDPNQMELKFSLQKGVIDGSSWLAIEEPQAHEGAYTFWFGTAIYPADKELPDFDSRFKSNNMEVRFHKIYSRVLIDMAVKKLVSMYPTNS